MNLMNRFVDRGALVRLETEDDPIKKAAMGLREYIPVAVTGFYLTFYAAAGPAGTGTEGTVSGTGGAVEARALVARTVVLPILGLIATFLLSLYKSLTSGSAASKWWQRIGTVVVPCLAFVAWVYVTGGNFFQWKTDPYWVAVGFAFLGLAGPAVFGILQRPAIVPKVERAKIVAGAAGGAPVDVEIQGTGFASDAKIELRQGTKTISALGVSKIEPTQITCTFELSKGDAGNWDLVVISSGQETAPYALTVEPA